MKLKPIKHQQSRLEEPTRRSDCPAARVQPRGRVSLHCRDCKRNRYGRKDRFSPLDHCARALTYRCEHLVAIVSQGIHALPRPALGAELFMTGERINRRLAAILAADVVGYSRLMAADEAGTLAALKRYREAIFDPAVTAGL